MSTEKVVTPESLQNKPNVVVNLEEDVLENEFAGYPDGKPPAGEVPIGTEVPVEPLTPGDRAAMAMLRVAESLEKMEARRESVRQLTYAEITPVSPFNPEGKRVRLTFTRDTYLHGIQLNPFLHTEEEIALFNKLKPGRYLDRKVEVQRNNNGDVNLVWEGGKQDSRIQMYSTYPTIKSMLTAIVAERTAKEEKRKRGEIDEDEVL